TDAPVEGAPTFYLTAYNRATAPSGARALGPGVFLLEGPSPSMPVTPAVTPRAPAAPSLIAITLACLSLLGLAGSGWSVAFSDGSALARVGLAPVIGLAVIGLVGLVSSRLGLGLGVGSWVIVAIATIGGWVFRNRSAAPIRVQRRLDGHP